MMKVQMRRSDNDNKTDGDLLEEGDEVRTWTWTCYLDSLDESPWFDADLIAISMGSNLDRKNKGELPMPMQLSTCDCLMN